MAWIAVSADNDVMVVDPDQARVSHRERMRAIRTLRAAARRGRLSDLTFVNRLQAVSDARQHRELQAATDDLPPGGLWARWRRAFARPSAAILDLRLPPAPETYVIGRDDRCDLRLAHATVSRRHALLKPVDGRWMIVDLSSMNGIRVNGWRVRGETPLSPGDLLDIGDLRLRIVP
jgi:hypothetical protein